MTRNRVISLLSVLVAVLAAAPAAASTFSNSAVILVPACLQGDCLGMGRAEPYPSTISVDGLPGTVARASVTLRGIAHPAPDEIDALLVGPGGQKELLISDACGTGATPLTGQTFTFDDLGPALTSTGPCASGTYKPTNFGSPDPFTPPAPAPPYGVALSEYAGGPPNGVWQLFVTDDGPNGSVNNPIAGGWSLELLPNATCGGTAATRAASVGTAGDDLLVGTQGPDVMLGLGGNDTIQGFAGKDIECGGPGRDKLVGGDGKDRLLGEGGKDTLKGGNGRDTCKGGPKPDSAKSCEKQKSI
jgi:hemolysin type calcium-binding protein